MDQEARTSVHGSSESQRPLQRRGFQRNTPPSHTPKISTNANNTSSTAHNQPLPPLAINSFKDISLVRPQFTVPPLPTAISSRRRSHSPDYRVSPNPARQVFSYPVSLPQDAPAGYSMSHDDGPQPLQKRKRSPETQARPLRSDEESDSRRGSASKGAMSYDPVHEYHQQAHQHHHSRRPSSAASQHSHVSSYSNQSSTNMEGDEPVSPMTGDQSISRDGKKRKHRCQECGQYFTRLHNLKSHLLTHSQEKPFICNECGHKFRRLHDLKRHHKLHTGERPYTCPGCSRSFARMDALNRHRKPGGECSLHNLSISSNPGSQQNSVERRMSLPPGFGRPASSQGSTSPMPQGTYTPSETGINPALAAASHGHSYPPTHLPPKAKHRYQHSGDASPGLLAPPSSNISFGRSPPAPTFGPAGNGRGIQPPPLVIPNPNTAPQGPTLSPIHSHHYSAGAQTGSSSSGGRSGPDPRSPIPPIMRDDGNAPQYALTDSPRRMTPPPIQAPPSLAVPPSTLPLLPSPGSLISPSPRNSYDRNSRQSLDANRPSETSRGYFDALIERNGRLEERVKQLENFVGILWQDREDAVRRQ